MIPWIQVYSNLITHPKTAKLAEELKLSSASVSSNVIAAGILVALWTWAIQNAYDGDLSASSASAIADACRWKKKPQTLLDALIGAGFIDEDGHIHDWEEYAVLILEQEDTRREKTRERVKRFRERRKATLGVIECQYCGAPATGVDHIVPLSQGGSDKSDNLVPCCQWCNSAKQDRPLEVFLNTHMDRIKVDSVTSCEKLSRYVRFDVTSNRFVTVTNDLCNAPTIPNLTKPYTGGSDNTARARTRETVENPVENYLDERGLDMDSYFGADAVKDEIRKLARALFDKFVERWPSTTDESEVFLIVTRAGQDADGNPTRIIDADARKLLIHAFHEASLCGKAGDWRYIRGILRNMAERGITTVEQAEDYEYEREGA